jgi:hypothetical protein
MALQFAVGTRNSWLEQIETDLGPSPRLKIFSGSPPADVSVADSGTLLADLTLPSDFMAAASGGTKALLGTWEDTSANGTGTAGYFRMYTSALVCKVQGTVATSAADMIVDDASFNTGQDFVITSFTITAPGA